MAESEDSGYSSSDLCSICSEKDSIYLCPRCYIQYCSLPCYQSEGHADCSEAFYRDRVLEDMKSRYSDPVAEKKMHEILKNQEEGSFYDNEYDNENLDSDDDESLEELMDRFRYVDLDDADSVWEQLTDGEKKEFEELLQSDNVGELVSSWEPWWLYRKEKILVQEVGNDAVSFNYEAQCPPLKKNVPSFSQITKTSPSPSVKYNVLNVLAAYCYMARFFNGELHNMPAESSSILVNLSANLLLNQNYDSAVTAVKAVACEAANREEIVGSIANVICMHNDVECILAGPEEENYNFYVLAALSDIHKLLTEAKTTMDKGSAEVKEGGKFTKRFSEKSAISPVPKDKLKLCIKKIEYYLSWYQEFYSDTGYQTLKLDEN